MSSQWSENIASVSPSSYGGSSSLQGKRSARTIQAYLTAIKGFARWLAIHQKLPRDPLASVKKPSPQADRRHERRILLPAEWPWLKAATLAGPVRFGMSPAERQLLYHTAIVTGLRAGELQSLTTASLFLDAKQPHLTAKAAHTENGKPAQQFLDAELAAALRLHTRLRGQGPLFALPHATNLAAMLRADLHTASQLWLDGAGENHEERERREASDFLAEKNLRGEVLDFHSLRHTCGAWLALQGANPKLVQTVMRHSTITLTLDTYGHLFPGQQASAVARVGELLSSKLNVISPPSDSTGVPHACQQGVEVVQRHVQRAEFEAVREKTGLQKICENGIHCKPQSDADLCHLMRVGAQDDGKCPCTDS